MTPRILIRTDCGAKHGLGHSTRMLALAKGLAARGAQVTFTTTTPALDTFVAPFPCETTQDAFVNVFALDLLIVDTKASDWANNEASLTRMQQCVCPVVRIDHPAAVEGSCRLLIAPCAHWSPATLTRLRHDFGARFLYGWDYVMLDEEVTSHPPIPYAEREHGPIVFCAGGSDPSGALAMMYAWTADVCLPDTQLYFMQGSHAIHPFSMAKQRKTYSTIAPYQYRAGVRAAAMVVGLFGITTYESLFWQTPMLCLTHTGEHQTGATYLEESASGAVRSIGLVGLHDAQSFQAYIMNAWENTVVRQNMTTAAMGLIDGLGTQRVADAILTLL